jgi:hypothetical protein
MVRRAAALGFAALVALAAAPAAGATGGSVTYRLNEGDVFRIAAQPGATPENISRALDAIAPGSDDAWLNTSPDGRFLLLETGRFGCADWPCLALVRGDLSSGEAIRVGDEAMHTEGFAAIASGGGLIVFPSQDGPHSIDLWAVRRAGDGWSAPALLTGASPFPFNSLPALSADGRNVAFECGAARPGEAGTAICRVGSDGSLLKVVLRPTAIRRGSRKNALHSPDFGPRGSVFFESDWMGEQIWRLKRGKRKPTRVSAVGNDNSPCVLPDGRVVSLWLDRPGNEHGLHEIRVTRSSGRKPLMLLTGKDVLDAGIGCGA